MAIREHPATGTILMCDYDTGFRSPEMVKRRPVVVISPRIVARPGLCTVVPLSTTAPDPVMQYHCQIDLPAVMPTWMDKIGVWVKADMVAAVALHRLDFIRIGKGAGGARIYAYETVSRDSIKKIRQSVLCGVGLSHLTKHV